jgi:hypothetical protein
MYPKIPLRGSVCRHLPLLRVIDPRFRVRQSAQVEDFEQ